jgi:hypothetical protein
MTKSEICRAIAERMESKPDNNYGRDGFSWASNRGFWFRAPIVNGKYQNWECVNFFDDESANALLLDSMRKDLSDRSYRVLLDLFHHLYDCRETDRKTAVVLAACKWLGIEVGEIEE